MHDFAVAAVFSDHMVLQRNKYITIFGYGNDGLDVEVSILNKRDEILSKNKTVIIEGRWEVQLEPQSAQNIYKD